MERLGVNKRYGEAYLRPGLQWACRVFMAALFPPKCLVCSTFDGMGRFGAESQQGPLKRLSPFMCPSCRSGIVPIESPLCCVCGMPFISQEGPDHRCALCLLGKRHFATARSFGVFDGSLMEAVHRLKYGKKFTLASPLSALVGETFFQFWTPGAIDLVVPVPLHIRRLRKRGFNQAYLLAKPWAKKAGLLVNGCVLRRKRWTEPQTAMNRKARRENVRGAFEIVMPERVSGKHVLLIDDVFTTGSTVDECARVLLRKGAHQVDVLTLARALY